MTDLQGSTGGMSLGMIEVCPGCRYSLRGLPERHTCPECGFRYDRNAGIVARPRVGLIIYGTSNAALLVAGVGLWWWFGQGLGQSLFVSVGLMGVLVATWRLSGKNRFVLVSRDELRVFDSGHQEEAFPMNRISDVKWSRISGSLTVTGVDGRELIVIAAGFLGSSRRLRFLASLIKRHLSAETPSIESLTDRT